MKAFFKSPVFSRAMGCLALGFVLALIVGPQEGTQDDYGYAFRTAIFDPRIFVFLGIGVVVFLALTYWPRVRPYLRRPGVLPLAIGFITVVAAFTLLHWYDPLGDGKFGTVAAAVGKTPTVSALTTAYFGWLGWALAVLCLLLAATAIVTGIRLLGWITVALSVFAAVIGYTSHSDVVSIAKGIDHSFGAGVAAIGFLTMGAAAMSMALSKVQVADSKAFISRVIGWRPGLPLAVIGVILGLLALSSATWFSPGGKNATLVDTATTFKGKGLAPIASAYLSWLGWVLLLAVAVLALVACYFRTSIAGWIAAVLGIVGVVLTLLTMYRFSALGGKLGIDAATGPWQNLGSAGWMMSGGLLLLAGAGFIAATNVPKAGAVECRRGQGRADREVVGCRGRQLLPGTRRYRDDRLRRHCLRVVLPAHRHAGVAVGPGHPDRDLRAVGHGSERRGRLGRSARSRVHRLLCHRLIRHGLPRRLAAGETAELAAHVAAAGHPVRHRGLSDRWCRPRHTNPAVAW